MVGTQHHRRETPLPTPNPTRTPTAALSVALSGVTCVDYDQSAFFAAL